MSTQNYLPKWLQTFKRFQTLKSELFLYGNVYDSYLFPINYSQVNSHSDLRYATFDKLKDVLKVYLFSQGFDVFSYFDVVDGIEVESTTSINIDNIQTQLALPSTGYISKAKTGSKSDAISLFREIIKNNRYLTACVINYSSRFTSNPNALEEDEVMDFLRILKAAQESVPFEQKQGKRNLLIFVCDKLNDIPAWLLLENPLTKGIEILKPDREERRLFFSQKKDKFFDSKNSESVKIEAERIYPDLTDGLTNREMENLITISKQEEMGVDKIKEIIDVFKYGLRENPWEKIENAVIRNAENTLKANVKGQDPAIRKAIGIIQRAKLGLDGIDKSRPSNKPKGVLFFAGPTGTGKTELAKSLASLIFNDEDAMIRFDMSEYNDSNSDVKLIGSPPGYVGYEDGGQLTDAIRKKPFSIILFDEIEKAHPKVFDKFLQILDDGRLTDGKGETVYFSQSLIVFTSNLGMYKTDNEGKRIKNIEFSFQEGKGDNYEEMKHKIMDEIKIFFNNHLGRPEILNRFGDNFVVFDFIRGSIAVQIIEKNIGIIISNLKKQLNITLIPSSTFKEDFLNQIAVDNLEMGGRGIVNKIETHIKNGLTTFLFEKDKIQDITIQMSILGNKVIFS